jgi:hypothetical protein
MKDLLDAHQQTEIVECYLAVLQGVATRLEALPASITGRPTERKGTASTTPSPLLGTRTIQESKAGQVYSHGYSFTTSFPPSGITGVISMKCDDGVVSMSNSMRWRVYLICINYPLMQLVYVLLNYHKHLLSI